MTKKKTSLRVHEKNYVEDPLMEQLAGLGWETLELKSPSEGIQYPEDSQRESFAEVVIKPELEKALKKINPFLTIDQIDQVIRQITNFQKSNSFIENNRFVFDLLLENTTVSENQETGEKSPTVKYIDFDNPENNRFVAISQFKIRIRGTERHIYPDITLFLNGLPIAVIECKSPKTDEPIPEAIDQLMRYSQQRGHDQEGNQELFYYNQVIVATCRNQAKFGTITTDIEKLFFRWSDPYPLSLEDIRTSEQTPNDQMRLVAGMFRKSSLLELMRSYTVFSTIDNKQIKMVGRYQQYRAVKKTIKQIQEGKNPRERSGIIWHTQGAGKSLTMMFLARELKRDPELKKWKIVFVTDRIKLEDQLLRTAQSSGYSVVDIESIKHLKEVLPRDSSELVMAMIHKFQDKNEIKYGVLDELNTSEKILILTDEAHRGQFKILGANLDKALPNATHIGFTGTPIEKAEKKYGDFIDMYTMRQSVDDGVTLEIVYEGRTHNAEVDNKPEAEQMFLDVFDEYDAQERLEILGYASKRAYLEAEDTIRAKAENMIDHYVEHVFTNGFKAQVVATSQLAALRYQAHIQAYIPKVIERLKRDNPWDVSIESLEKLKIGLVVSGIGHNDNPELKNHPDNRNHESIIDSFKLSFDKEKDGVRGDYGILVVNSMLLTGFDAPIEQVMYLDRKLVAHNLLQAIARVNRVYNQSKQKGFIVDYIGIGHHLKKAIETYDEKEKLRIDPEFVNEIYQNLEAVLANEEEELNNLKTIDSKINEFLKKYKVTNLDDYDAFYDLFYDEKLRLEFVTLYEDFARALDIVLPRKEALDYLKHYYQLSEIYAFARQHFRDKRMSMKGVSKKMRSITDKYLVSKGINTKVPPVSILDQEFEKKVKKHSSAKNKSAEIEHAVRDYIEEHIHEDPELYQSFAEALERIFTLNQENWDQVYNELQRLVKKIKRESEKPAPHGLNKKKHMPIFRLIKKELGLKLQVADESNLKKIADMTIEISDLLQQELKFAGYWNRQPVQNRTKGEIQHLILSKKYTQAFPQIYTHRDAIVSRIMEVAKANNDAIIYSQ